MSSIENRIVSMKFENSQFESGVRTTMSTLDRLKAALNFSKQGQGIQEVQKAANGFNLNGMSNATDGVAAKFSAMSAIAIGALMRIGSKAVDVGLQIAKSFTIEPLKQGFQEYETNLNAVQTILANTQASGATLKDVNARLSELNEYSDKTIYNFSEMARNIGTFTAAGVDLNTATGAIKGIANLAALSGSNSTQASTAMYQLSQAISAGRVSLQDWNSVVNAGMGGTVFQRALAQTAEKMGTLKKGAVELTGPMKNVSIEGKSFRESITAEPGKESWLTSAVLTNTLKQFTGDMSDAELATMGFTREQIAGIQAQAKTAQEAATQVKTFTQLIDTLKESAGSGWAQTFQTIFGDFEQAKSLWTGVNNVLGDLIGKSAESRNKMLADWRDLGGRADILAGISNLFKTFTEIAKPIGAAFREMFPPVTGQQLANLSKNFLHFTESIKLGEGTLNNIKSTAKGFFAILSIGMQVIGAIVGGIASLFGAVGKGSGSFLEITGSVGNYLVKLDETLKRTGILNDIFRALANAVKAPIAALGLLGKAFVSLFTGNASNERLSGLARIFDALKGAGDRLKPVMESVTRSVVEFFSKLSSNFQGGDFSAIADALNAGLLGGILFVLKKFKDEGLSIDWSGGIVEGIKETFGTLTDTVKNMQTQIQSKTLMNIAVAIGILTASIVALSLIDSGSLTKSLTAIAVGFAQLAAMMAILTKISGSAGFIKIPMIAASLILLSAAMLILSASVMLLSRLSWDELARGLVGVGVSLGLLAGFALLMNNSTGPILRVGMAMIPLAVGLLILSAAVRSFSDMSWGDMAKGLVGLAGSLLIIAAAMQLMPKDMLLQAVGLTILSIALQGISNAVMNMGGMSWGEIAKGLVALGGSLVILAAALYLMTGALPGAAALIVAAAAISILAPALVLLGGMSWGDIAKGLVMLAGSLIILAGGLYLMSAALPGAAALIVAAAALAILAPVLVTLGAMSWSNIGAGLVMLAGSLAIIAAAAYLVTPVLPGLLGLGAAIMLIGAGAFLAGAGLLAVATAFAIFTAAGAAGLAIITGMIALIPLFLTTLAQGIIAFAVTIGNGATAIVGAFTALLTAILNSIIQMSPLMAQAFLALLNAILNVLSSAIPRIAQVGMQLMLALLNAIRQNIPQIVSVSSQIIVSLIQAMGSKVPAIVRVGTDLIIQLMQAITASQGRLINAGITMITSFINGLANTIRARSGEMRSAGVNLAMAIVDGMTGGLASAAGRVAARAAQMARDALGAAKNALNINSPSKEFYKLGEFSGDGMENAFDDARGRVASSAAEMAKGALRAAAKTMQGMSEMSPLDPSFKPVITPILDLSEVSRGARDIPTMLSSGLSVDYNARQVSSIANDVESVRSNEPAQTVINENHFEFNQNITAPESIDAGEIYRNTKSQFALFKEEVA